jgi:hypothetical protein
MLQSASKRLLQIILHCTTLPRPSATPGLDVGCENDLQGPKFGYRCCISRIKLVESVKSL